MVFQFLVAADKCLYEIMSIRDLALDEGADQEHIIETWLGDYRDLVY